MPSRILENVPNHVATMRDQNKQLITTAEASSERQQHGNSSTTTMIPPAPAAVAVPAVAPPVLKLSFGGVDFSLLPRQASDGTITFESMGQHQAVLSLKNFTGTLRVTATTTATTTATSTIRRQDSVTPSPQANHTNSNIAKQQRASAAAANAAVAAAATRLSSPENNRLHNHHHPHHQLVRKDSTTSSQPTPITTNNNHGRQQQHKNPRSTSTQQVNQVVAANRSSPLPYHSPVKRSRSSRGGSSSGDSDGASTSDRGAAANKKVKKTATPLSQQLPPSPIATHNSNNLKSTNGTSTAAGVSSSSSQRLQLSQPDCSQTQPSGSSSQVSEGEEEEMVDIQQKLTLRHDSDDDDEEMQELPKPTQLQQDEEDEDNEEMELEETKKAAAADKDRDKKSKSKDKKKTNENDDEDESVATRKAEDEDDESLGTRPAEDEDDEVYEDKKQEEKRKTIVKQDNPEELFQKEEPEKEELVKNKAKTTSKPSSQIPSAEETAETSNKKALEAAAAALIEAPPKTAITPRAITPANRWGHNMAMVDDNRILLYGGQAFVQKDGCNDVVPTTLSDIHVFDLETQKWIEHFQSEQNRYAKQWASATYLPERQLLVVFGGESMNPKTGRTTTSDKNNLMVLDTEILLWYPPTATGDLPSGRSGHTGTLLPASAKQELVIFGGVKASKHLNTVSVLDTKGWKWSTPKIQGIAPKARSYHSATAIQATHCGHHSDHISNSKNAVANIRQRIVVFGGNDHKESFNTVHVLEKIEGAASSWRWFHPTVTGAPPAPRTGHSAVLLEDQKTICIYGGWDPVNEDEEENPSDDTTLIFQDSFLLCTETWSWKPGPAPVFAGHSLDASHGNNGGGRRVGHCAVLNTMKNVKSTSEIFVFGGRVPGDDFCGDFQTLTISR